MSSTTTTVNSSASANLPSTHQALVQDVYAEPFILKTLPVPQPVLGAAIIKIEVTNILSYSINIYNGKRRYPYPTPLTPGSSAIGRIASLPADATSLRLNQLVLYDCVMRSRDQPSDVFLGHIYEGDRPGAKKLMRDAWRDGTYAQYARVPLENLFALDEEKLCGDLGYRLEDLAVINGLLVPYGGLVDVGVKIGETVVVAPATGGFGGMAVKVALALGAGKVVAMGRNERQLSQVVADGGGRVVSVKMTGDWEEEVRELKKAIGGRTGEADVFFDISPPAAAHSSHLKAGFMCLRQEGRVSLMGGQLEDLKMPIRKIMHWNLTVKGKWMYERSDVIDLIKMIECGALKLGKGQGASVNCSGVYGLDKWEEAFKKAEADLGQGFVVFKP